MINLHLKNAGLIGCNVSAEIVSVLKKSSHNLAFSVNSKKKFFIHPLKTEIIVVKFAPEKKEVCMASIFLQISI